MIRISPGTETALVFGGALLLFAMTVTAFEARVTDVSALRVLNGDVPYRDFWTMYAPGSFTTLAIAFALFGRELLVSNVLGIVTSAGAVAMYYRLARRACGSGVARLSAGLVAAAFFGTGYHNGFTSYPPAFFLILAAAYRVASRLTEPGWTWVIVPGLLFGGAALFKHDIAAYAAIAAGGALVIARHRAGIVPVWTPTLLLGVLAAVIVASGAAALAALGAGPDLWRDLVVFPLTDFKYVRPEYFPIIPRVQGASIATAQELVLWVTCNVPLLALVTGVPGLVRRRQELDPPTIFIVGFALVAFWLHWAAGHVQLNTNAISLTAWGALVGGAGLRGTTASTFAKYRLAATAAVLVWGMVLIAEPVFRAATRTSGTQWLGLPQLHGIRVPHSDAAWMRQLASALAESPDPEAPLLLLSHRNDVHVYAQSAPFWLTSRPSATRHHELHPGITDTEPIQRQMLTRLQGLAPVVVREYRFSSETLDDMKADFARHVPVGSRLIDHWVEQRYEEGPRFGAYEVMRPRSTATSDLHASTVRNR